MGGTENAHEGMMDTLLRNAPEDSISLARALALETGIVQEFRSSIISEVGLANFQHDTYHHLDGNIISRL